MSVAISVIYNSSTAEKRDGCRDGDQKEKTMSTKTLNVLNGIAHVLGTMGHDGATDADGEPVSIGLRREEGHLINDSRVMDGFSVKTSADKLWICYHLETTLKEIHAEAKFESGIKSAINDVKGFLQREYKKVTGRSLSLKEMDASPFLRD